MEWKRKGRRRVRKRVVNRRLEVVAGSLDRKRSSFEVMYLRFELRELVG